MSAPDVVAPVPSGGDDLGALQTIFAGLGANGGLALMRPGTYLVSNTLVVPNKVTARAPGRSATSIKPGPGFPAGAPVVRLGPMGLAFGSRLERVTVDCAGQGVGVYSYQAQEMCGLDQVAVVNFTDTAVHMDGGCADFALDNIEGYPVAAGANYGIHLHNAGSNIVRKATVGVNGPLTAGIYVNGGEAVLQSIHVENCTDGIVYDNANGFAYGISGPTVNANVTNLVRQASNCRYLTLIDLTRNSATTTFVDQFHGLTVTDPYVQTAVLGDLYAARVHSPQLDALTARVAALEAKV